MGWRIEYTAGARAQFNRLDRQVYQRIVHYLEHSVATLESPRQRGRALTGDRAGQWRYRVGDYRVICEIQDDRLVVLVVDAGHRSRVYR